ncbi:LacI family DNA-binding transcriptional regulator [Kineosporia succinea]|uniref:DNA-binding LacI/PurR family transcriptional regulator n=1 Tax=Kineosporia succinea TaxID=84632 RepID=A0ABT9P821_9ACTN|nr:substrate-binding domain-containing protein [Kineosporia succinea]MDP9828851.1 DNA-binding LacI/PurR family transcriptional regulator [Kineosporia succinea]
MSAGPESERPLLAVDRQQQLLDLIQQRGTVRVAELVTELDVAAATIRRDIAALAADGLVQRVHGGATTARADAVPSESLLETGILGMLVPSLDYYWPGIVRGAEVAARENGLRVVLRGSSYTIDDERPHLTRLLEQGAGAILVSPSPASPHLAETVDQLGDLDVPVVVVERPGLAEPAGRPFEHVHSDHAFGGARATKHLLALGHRRIAFACPPESPTGPAVREGWSRVLDTLDVPTASRIDLSIPQHGSTISETAVDHVVDELLASGSTAALVHADAHAIAIVQRLEDRGFSVPADLSVVAYDDEFASLFSPSLTAVRPARAAIGRAAVELAAARLADPDRPTHRVVVLPTLHVRESSAGPKG